MRKVLALRYALAAAVSIVTLTPWITFGQHIEPSPFRFLFVAVLVSALYGGVGPGLLAAVLGCVAGAFYTTPRPAENIDGILQIGSFCAVALTIIWLVSRKARAERHRLELVLRDQEIRAQAQEARVLQAVMRASPLPTVSVDAAGRVTTWNAAAERAFGWTEAEVLDLPLPLVPEEQQTQCHEHIAATMGGRSLLDVPTVSRTRDGCHVDVTLSSAPVYDDQGRAIGAILVYVALAGLTAPARLESIVPTSIPIQG
jgi:PAS domain S-box-containing protein